VQQRRAERLGIEPHAGADLGHPNRVGDELVARVAQLVGVVIAGKVKGAFDRGPVDRRNRYGYVAIGGAGMAVGAILTPRRGVELLDDGEEIGQEPPVRYVCLCASRYWRASSWRAL